MFLFNERRWITLKRRNDDRTTVIPFKQQVLLTKHFDTIETPSYVYEENLDFVGQFKVFIVHSEVKTP